MYPFVSIAYAQSAGDAGSQSPFFSIYSTCINPWSLLVFDHPTAAKKAERAHAYGREFEKR